MTAGSRHRAARWVHGVVIDWTLLITRGLPAAIARDRFEQIVSDLWEEGDAADRRDTSGVRLATSMLLRAARGAPADLGWRWRVLRETPASASARPVRAKAWVPLSAVRPFDQTNGSIVFDNGPRHDGRNVERDLMELGAASNIVVFGGGLSG